MTRVSGYRRVPDPPASTIPFMMRDPPPLARRHYRASQPGIARAWKKSEGLFRREPRGLVRPSARENGGNGACEDVEIEQQRLRLNVSDVEPDLFRERQ